jgi:dodecin
MLARGAAIASILAFHLAEQSGVAQTAAKSLRDLRIAEVAKLDMKIENDKITAYRARVMLSFKYEA